MVLAMRSWGIREWLMALFGLLWCAVTLLLAQRGSTVIERVEWWAGGPALLLAVWKIFAPPPPPSQGGE